MKNNLKVIPLGGLGEFGKNCLLLEYGADFILIDFGLKFSTRKEYGIDYEIPDIRFLKNNRDRLKAIIITHAHLDHIGGLPFLIESLNIPIYASTFAAAIIRRVLKNNHNRKAKINIIEPNKIFRIGAFEIDPITINHSIPETFAFAIKTPSGIVLHSGDFRNDRHPYYGLRTDMKKLKKYGSQKVLALFSDSTNAPSHSEYVSEQNIFKNIEKIFKSHKKNRIIFSTFSTQISRVKKIMNLAKKYKRSVFLAGRAMNENINAAIDNDLLDDCEDILLSNKAFKQSKSQETVIIATGSQGEPNSSLIKISRKQHPFIQLLKEDVIVLSSSTIPGNEKSVEKLLDNFAYNQNVIITNDDMDIHSSGHGYRKELAELLQAVRPKYFFPIHGNCLNMYRHKNIALEAGWLSKNIFVLENGQKIELHERNVSYLEKIRLKELFVINNKIQTVRPETIEDREVLSKAGVVFVNALMQQTSLVDLVIQTSGVGEAGPHMVIELKQRLLKVLEEGDAPLKASRIQKHVKKEVEFFMRKLNFNIPKIICTVNTL